MGTAASTAQDPSSSTVSTGSTSIPVQNSSEFPVSSFHPNYSRPSFSGEGSSILHLDDSGENDVKSPNHRVISNDGYKWRKYGQKSVKGSQYPRSYYKCTYAGCTVKKFVEQCESEGKIIDKVSYKGGDHNHDSIVVTRLNAADQQSFKKSVISENRSPTLKSEIVSLKETSEIVIESSSTELPHSTITAGSSPAIPKLVVETATEVDHLDDGYNWRKYGQKNVKGSQNPRSYYKCTEAECSVKKQVEKRGQTIINTYEGTHNHSAPGANSSVKKRKISRHLDSQFEKLNSPKNSVSLNGKPSIESEEFQENQSEEDQN